MRVILSITASFSALALALGMSAAAHAQDGLPDGPGKTAIQESCAQCHDLGTAVGRKRTPDEWADVLDRMAGFGLTLSDDKRAEIETYLNTHLSSAPAAATPQTPAGTPTGGKP